MERSRWLLDTHVLLWLKSGSTRLSPEIIESFRGSQPFLSVATLRELVLLCDRGFIVLKEPMEDWLADCCKGCEILSINEKIASDSVTLPRFDTGGNLTDCELIATARVHSLTLLTSDPCILDYSGVRALDPTLPENIIKITGDTQKGP